MLADLRESGCLTAGTRILRADTGTEVTLGELLASRERNVPVWSLDESLRLVARPLTHAFASGTKEVFRVTLCSGRVVEATANHPFLTADGWLSLGELTEGSPVVFGLSRAQVASFLRHLWATDGCIRHLDDSGRSVQIYYTTTSRRLADDVSHLLLRVGVLARIAVVGKPGDRDRYHVSVTGQDNQRAFLARVAAVLEDSALPLAATDVFWDGIFSIESIGEQPVYDATVLETHNFVANGINLHNSLEQDADMVMLIHRPDAWERDDPRAGEADLILAKHRNGPTATVTVAHQLHYSRFSDMAQG
jgi:replicative DNA helicase